LKVFFVEILLVTFFATDFCMLCILVVIGKTFYSQSNDIYVR
jgi:hypothetical protein